VLLKRVILSSKITLPEYPELLERLKERIKSARIKASLAVNQELILLYWQIGREIIAQQKIAGWGGKVIEKLAKDLRKEFPEMKGLSRTNLLYMRKLASVWPDEKIVW
jgi:predicted nuclease of restriction endonuclease-like (RecB) superfamily